MQLIVFKIHYIMQIAMTVLYVLVLRHIYVLVSPRTSTVWKTLSPFWGEEYTLHLPNGFHQVSIYVYDEDVMR